MNKTIFTIMTFVCMFTHTLTFSGVTKYRLQQIREEADSLNNWGQYHEALALYREMAGQAEKQGFPEEKAWAHVLMGNVLCSMGRHRESLESINKAKIYARKMNDPIILIYIAIETGRNYDYQKVSFSEAVKEFKKAERLALTIKEKETRDRFLYAAYTQLITPYMNRNEPDSAFLYAHKALSIKEESYPLDFIAYYHIHHSQNRDSVLHYLNRSAEFLKDRHHLHYHIALNQNMWGDFLFEEKNYEEAIGYYLEVIRFSTSPAIVDEKLRALTTLANCYEKLGDMEKQIFYVREHKALQDSLANALMNEVKHSVSNIIEQRESEFRKHISSRERIFRITLISAVLIILYLFFVITKSRLHKRQQIEKAKRLLREKEERFKDVQKESEVLAKKLNESFGEIAELAKVNDPSFLTRFREIYPEFTERMLKAHPGLTNTDQILCAMIYLNFSSKEIAGYTFVEHRSVQTRKRRLRRKMDLPPATDLYQYLKLFE